MKEMRVPCLCECSVRVLFGAVDSDESEFLRCDVRVGLRARFGGFACVLCGGVCGRFCT